MLEINKVKARNDGAYELNLMALMGTSKNPNILSIIEDMPIRGRTMQELLVASNSSNEEVVYLL